VIAENFYAIAHKENIYLNEHPWVAVEDHVTSFYTASLLVLTLSHRNEAWKCKL
jgi:hypothetical protein